MRYTKDNPLRVITLFSGYDSQCLALDRLKENYPHQQFDYELVAWCEIDKAAITAHNALYPQWADRNIGDITKVDAKALPDCDLITWSFPCFVAGTLVLTSKGYKQIEDIKVGDMVLTHTNKFRQVLSISMKPYTGEMAHIHGMGMDGIYCTNEHPFYVRRKYRKGHEGIRSFHEPEWVKAKNLDKNCYLGYAINQACGLPKWDGVAGDRWGNITNQISGLLDKPYFWYLMGRYVGDGWKRSNGSGIVICCSERNEKSLADAIKMCGFNFCPSRERTVSKFHIPYKELYEFVGRYGYYAHGKRVDIETLNLPPDLLGSFVMGCFDSDGYEKDNLCKISTVSRDLCYGLAQCIAKAFHRPFSIYRTKRKPETIIEGRRVSQKDSYTVTWKFSASKQDKAFYENGYIWYPLTELPILREDNVEVFNMSVYEDESYTANGAIVHNCTDISAAGRQAGLSQGSGTRSSLAWEAIRIFREKHPKYLLMENVKALVQKKFIKDFNALQGELEKIGYANFTAVLNATDYGVPQHRERVFMVSILRTECDPEPRYHFPAPLPLEKRLKDVLEDKVEEKYYLSDKMLEYFQRVNEDTSHGHKFTPKDMGGVAFTIRTAPGQRVDDNFVFDE